MKRRGRWGNRWWRALGPAALLVSLAVPQVAVTSPLVVAAAAPVAGRPELSTYAGALAAGKRRALIVTSNGPPLPGLTKASFKRPSGSASTCAATDEETIS